MTLLPILWIAVYNVPCADDFNYGLMTHHTWMKTHNLFHVFKMSLREVKNFYLHWQGTWFAIWLMSLQPAVFSESLYPLGTVMQLISLLGGLYFLLKTLIVDIAHEARSKCVIIWAIISTICIQFLPSASQGLFWYNGAVFYTFFYGIFLLGEGLALRYAYFPNSKNRIGDLAVICILMLLLGGGNYALCLLTSELWVLIELCLVWKHNNRWKELLLPAVFFFTSFAISIVSPGNAVRQAAFEERPSVIESIQISFSKTFICTTEWLTLPVLLLLLLLLPVLWSIVSESERCWPFRNPGLVTGISFCLLSSMNTPSIYATGELGPGRYQNIVFYFLILLLVFNMFYWMGWFHRKIKALEQGNVLLDFLSTHEGYRLALIVLVIASVWISVETLPNGKRVTTCSAWDSLRSGQAWEYRETFDRRMKILQDDKITDAVLPSYIHMPYVLYFDDITSEPGDWRNKSMAEYYDKNSVIREEELFYWDFS